MQQVSVLETNIGSSTTGNSANTQIIFNDAGTLRGDTGLVYNKTTDALTVTGLVTAGSATITGDLTVDTSTLKVDSTNNRVGIVQATPLYPLHLVGEFGLEEASSGNGTKLRLIGDASKYNFRLGKQLTATNTFEITPSTAVGGTTFSNPVYTVTYDGTHTFLDGAGGTRMTLNSTGLGVGVSPSFKLDVQGAGIRLNSGSATGFTILRLGGIASDSFFGFAGNANDIVTGSSAGDTVIGSNKAGANLRFISGNGVLNATLDASGNLLVTKTAISASTLGCELTASGQINGATANLDNLNIYNTTAAAYRFYVSGAGTIFATNTVISAISDARLKENVQDIDVGLAAILSLKPRKFDWKAGKGKDIKGDRGFIAQEFETVFPNLVDEWKDPAPEGEAPYKSVRQDLIPVLVKAIQELTARVQTLEAR
jgi:hypothetical protein